MTTFIGRGPGTSPTTDFFPLSASLPSAPVIVISATISSSANTIHTADARAYDVPIVYVANVGGVSGAVVYLNMGATGAALATTQSIALAVATSSYGLIQPGTPISGSGVVYMWSTSVAGTFAAYGGVTRTYTASA
jgi:hypothetical protein